MSEELFIAKVKTGLTGLVCPACGGDADGATSIDDRRHVTKAKPGDVACCASCGAWLTYIEAPTSPAGIGLRQMTAEEWAATRRDPRLKKLMDAGALGREFYKTRKGRQQ